MHNVWLIFWCIRYAAAELDCSEAITRDPAYVKAFCRRALARVALKNYEGAREDYRRVLELEPNNKLAQTELKAVEQVWQCSCSTVLVCRINIFLVLCRQENIIRIWYLCDEINYASSYEILNIWNLWKLYMYITTVVRFLITLSDHKGYFYYFYYWKPFCMQYLQKCGICLLGLIIQL